jgi:hypothetical protein
MVIGSTCNVPRPLPLKLSYIGYLGSATVSLISDAVAQRNSQQSPLLRPLGDFEPSYEAHSKRPRFRAIRHPWQHALVKDTRLETLRNIVRMLPSRVGFDD